MRFLPERLLFSNSSPCSSPRQFLPPMKTSRLLRLVAAVAALATAARLSAQLQWSVFNETSSTAAPASTATSGVTLTVAAGQRATLVATNFVPVDFSSVSSGEVYVTVNFKASGGLGSIAGGTRAIGFGLYNNNGTISDTTFADDNGYFTWLNGRNTGSLIELRRRNGDGTSPSLLNPTGTAFNSLGTGTTTQTVGALSDGNNYAIQLHLIRTATGVSLGNTSSTTTGAGIWVSGDGLSQTAYTNPDVPPATTVFNELGFMFFNSTAADVTLTINSLTGLTAINPPAVATPPAAISLNPGQTGSLSVVATGTAPLAYQWRKDGTAIAGAIAATLALPNAQAADAGSYSVAITNAYGSVTSSAAAVTVTTAAIPATITNQPVGLTLNAGQPAAFSVAAFGSSPVSYQWRKNGTAIAGATTGTFSIAAVTAADAGDYTVVVINATSSVTSTAATLAVNTAPAITTQPASVTAAVGQNVSFSVVATGSPAPTYQWKRNGANVAGATSATLALTGVTLANTGVYTVAVTNSVGAVTSAAAVLAIPSTMVATTLSPANSATAINTDAPLSITFDRAPTVGTTGRIRIFKASDNTVVDTLDLGVTPYRRAIGTQTVDFIFLPIIVTGNTAAIFPHAGVLAYGQSYYVTVEQSALLDSTGASFTGISDPAAWRFTTKAAGPAANATAVTVAADGSGDFTTVQGAIDFVPLNNSQRVVITVKRGTYPEMNYVGSQKPFVTVRGEDRALTIIQYANNNNFNTLTGNNRAMFNVDASDFTLETITLKNTTPQGGSQAEAYRGNGLRHILNRVNLLSRQDTLLINGSNATAFITDSYIEGNTDFMWGSGAVYVQRTELKALDTGTATEGYYTQIRNGATQFGNVYVDCRLTVADGVVGKTTYFLGRIDPNPGNFPYSQAVWLNCAMGPHISPAGWLLNNATAAPTVQNWEYQSTDLTGGTLDVTKRLASSRQLSEIEATLWRNPAFVLGGWSPQIAATIETSPGALTATAGSNAKLTVVANGAPQPALQWFKDGASIAGATGDTLLLTNIQSAAAGRYTVTATNSGGTATSAAATVAITGGKFAGVYFGTVGGSAGTFALYVRDNGTGVFYSVGAGAAGAFVARAVTVDDSGRLRATAGSFALDATIGAAGGITGSVGPAPGSGLLVASLELTGARAAASGVSQSFAGYFQTGASNAAATAVLIVSADGRAYALVQNGASIVAGNGTVDAAGRVSVSLAGGTVVAATVVPGGASAAATITPAAGAAITTAGAGDSAAAAQRLREFSARARVDAANPAAIGFVVTGDSPDNVLIRAVGPTLGDAFAVAGALPNPRLDIYRGAALIATNVNWTTAVSPSDIALGAVQSGAFPLRTTFADSALRLTLPAGAYTAVMSSASGATAGIGLMEIYDVSAGVAGQRLVNLSARGPVGNGANALLAGFFVAGTQPKRILLRGIGPGLTAFGVTSAVAKPVLTLYRGAAQVAQNTGWSTGADASAIASAALESGAFALGAASADSAILVNLAPGLYTAQITSLDAVVGTGLIEIYELP